MKNEEKGQKGIVEKVREKKDAKKSTVTR